MLRPDRPRRAERVRRTPLAAIFGGMVWPRPGEPLSEVEWRLRYGNPSNADLITAASCVSAFAAIVEKPRRERNRIIAAIRSVSDERLARGARKER